jgi:hypothetical protein
MDPQNSHSHSVISPKMHRLRHPVELPLGSRQSLAYLHCASFSLVQGEKGIDN